MGNINKDNQALIMVIVIRKIAPLYFPKLIQINYDLMLRMKWLWFVPNLMKILSIFLKLHAIKQSGLTFLAYLV